MAEESNDDDDDIDFDLVRLADDLIFQVCLRFDLCELVWMRSYGNTCVRGIIRRHDFRLGYNERNHGSVWWFSHHSDSVSLVDHGWVSAFRLRPSRVSRVFRVERIIEGLMMFEFPRIELVYVSGSLLIFAVPDRGFLLFNLWNSNLQLVAFDPEATLESMRTSLSFYTDTVNANFFVFQWVLKYERSVVVFSWNSRNPSEINRLPAQLVQDFTLEDLNHPRLVVLTEDSLYTYCLLSFRENIPVYIRGEAGRDSILPLELNVSVTFLRRWRNVSSHMFDMSGRFAVRYDYFENAYNSSHQARRVSLYQLRDVSTGFWHLVSFAPIDYLPVGQLRLVRNSLISGNGYLYFTWARIRAGVGSILLLATT
ncbi:hypothetical protein QVD17_27613 [Tagetes erecta]|uniref:Uncharacterized protein n=1 Tax=Tagetes erecta TaxID=13708 RepID=A0AAD8K9D1_TARER|nr:hypothetical protein QVD17_27613 [Tagetes erecta]